MEVYAYEPLGYEGCLVRIEVDIRRGIPAIDIVGLAATAVRESRERVRAAIRNSGFEFPQDRVLINLSPADLPKEGASYDLPIAVKILAASGAIPDCGQTMLVMGELTLDGRIHPVRAALPAFIRALDHDIRHFIVPVESAGELAKMRQGQGKIYPVSRISELTEIMLAIRNGLAYVPEVQGCPMEIYPGVESAGKRGSCGIVGSDSRAPDFSDYHGNDELMRAVVIAAAGRHNMLLFGPPGSGKTAAATRFPSLLPPLTEKEAIEVGVIWSLCGKGLEAGNDSTGGLPRPPVRAPHHSASAEGMIGGGRPVKPGEISLAHRGVLFLDETTEFRRDVLQSLREPMEKGFVTIVRAGRVLQYPADFQLLLAANPCPCGNLGSSTKACLCSPMEIQRYWKKLGGPLLDRIDMRIPVRAPGPDALLSEETGRQQRLMTTAARAIRAQRQRTAEWGGISNGRLSPEQVSRFCVLTGSAKNLLIEKAQEMALSARACQSILKIARTIADVDGKMSIDDIVVEEAVGYRQFGDGEMYWPF
ncbi:MAG: YifB family Mg chelatase-like AAA ATPase [Spirochaetaceae bacterium]|nr:YifB family Mg chelatase-like AAA ATPase [Spirochaetaceae bacterium]